MANKVDAILEGLALLFNALSFANRSMRRSTGESFGDILGKIISKEKEQLARVPPRAKVYKAGSDIEGRVSHIVKMIRKYREDPRIRDIASAILTKRCGDSWCVPEKDWLAELEAVFKAIKKNIRYTRDIVSKVTFVSPVRTLAQYHIGDCDDLTIALGSILGHIGYPVKLRVIQTVGNKDYNHIYLLAGIPPSRPTKWVAMDASVNKPMGFQAPREIVIKYRDFMV